MVDKLRKDWLPEELSDDDGDQGYDSEAADERPGRRTWKRRKIARDDEDTDAEDSDLDSEAEEIERNVDIDEETLRPTKAAPRNDAVDASDKTLSAGHRGHDAEEQLETNEGEPEEHGKSRGPRLSTKSKPLFIHEKKARKTGVVYLSRIPPFMKPAAVKTYLQPFGAIGRIFLTPEDPTAHTRRVKAGGNKKRSFVDGWVEFLSKKDAKACASTLNTQIVGGKKGSWYHDDVWNIKYLKGFKWDNLIEQIKNENAERAARLRAEISQTTRENKRFLANVERAKMLEGIRSKRKGGQPDLQGPNSANGDAVTATAAAPVPSQRRFEQNFRQNAVKKRPRGDDNMDSHSRSVLSGIL